MGSLGLLGLCISLRLLRNFVLGLCVGFAVCNWLDGCFRSAVIHCGRFTVVGHFTVYLWDGVFSLTGGGGCGLCIEVLDSRSCGVINVVFRFDYFLLEVLW